MFGEGDGVEDVVSFGIICGEVRLESGKCGVSFDMWGVLVGVKLQQGEKREPYSREAEVFIDKHLS